MSYTVSRRQFMAAAGLAAATTLAPKVTAQSTTPQVCVFSKHLQHLDYTELAATCKELGLDGVDLTVRAKGHVLPARVADDLPRAVEAIRAEGLDVPMITTRLCSGDDPDAKPILEAASKLGIRYFRVGGQRYEETGDPSVQLPKFIEELRSLAQLAEANHMVAGYHNHSGYNNVGASMWDLRHIFDTVGSEHLGSNFDVGHAKVEGAYGAWQINTRLMAPHIKMMAVKDFVWKDGQEKPAWVPLGEGIVPLKEMLAIIRESGFAGPISMHFEYKIRARQAVLDAIRTAAVTLRAGLQEAGYV